MKLKVCGLKNEKNILEVLASKPDFIGFIFYEKSSRFVGNELSPEFVKKISSAKKVGVFVNESEKKIFETAAKFALDYVQLHGNETPEFCEKIQKKIPVIKAFGIGEEFYFSSLTKYENVCDYFLFDSSSKQFGGTGKPFNWEKLKEYTSEKKIFLSGGIDLKNSDEIIRMKAEIPKLFAVDINSCFETEPGIKDALKVNKFSKKIKK